MSTFAELTKRVHFINDLILSGMISEKKNYAEESLEFRTHMLITKDWFSRVSWVNKKRFVLTLLEDVNSVWTLSLLLKSIWNCRPKDSVLSVCWSRVWSSYDQVPLDHNRTALPLSTLNEVMKNERRWFLTLEPETQAMLLSDLLTIAGGPIMWEVLKRAEALYDVYAEHESKNLQECNVVHEHVAEKVKTTEQPKKDQTTPRKNSTGQTDVLRIPGQAQKELEANLAAWQATVKSMRDRLKLEELEMVFSDGSKKRVWKVNRPKPEVTETVDIIQLLPSEIGKRILMYLPTTQLSDCARVNKYWSYLIDELRTEFTTRQKINIELEKLKENVIKRDMSLGMLARSGVLSGNQTPPPTTTEQSRKTTTLASTTNTNLRNTKLQFKGKAKKKTKIINSSQKPIPNMTELNERLQRRGAADEYLWKWCEQLLCDNKASGEVSLFEDTYEIANDLAAPPIRPPITTAAKPTEGVVLLNPEGFPCPLMKYSLSVPLKSPIIVKNPNDECSLIESTVNVIPTEEVHEVSKPDSRHTSYSLWSKNMSGLFPVSKIPSYRFS